MKIKVSKIFKVNIHMQACMKVDIGTGDTEVYAPTFHNFACKVPLCLCSF